ncbi:MAG: hypothetical protein ABI315_09655 [Bacteroidia bacterium]
MKKAIILSIIYFLSCNFSFGQDSTEVKFRITTTPIQLFFYDFPLNFEKSFKKYTVGVIASYRLSTRNSGRVSGGAGLLGGYRTQNFWNPLYNAFTIGLNSKYYFVKEKHDFIESILFYRYWWFNNKDCEYDNVEGYNFQGTRTERQDIFGLKLLYGHSFTIKIKSNVKPIIDLYVGLGLRYITYKFETVNGKVKDIYYDYKQDIGNSWAPTFHFGLKLGLGIFK